MSEIAPISDNKYITLETITGGSQPFRESKEPILIYVRSGSISIRTVEHDVTMAIGNICLILPGTALAYEIDSISSIDILHISSDFLETYIDEYGDMVPDKIALDIDAKVIDTLEMTKNKYLITSILNYIVYRYIDSTTYKRANAKIRDFVSGTINYIESNYDKEPTIDGLASELGYATHYVSTLIGKTFKKTFMALINERRIERAILLLKDETLTITDIAIDCGYGAQRSFNRNFAYVMGSTPSEYREQLKKN